MRQALHIFRKDVRHLWPEISVTLAAAAAFTFTVARGAQSGSDPGTTQGVALTMLTYLLPATWWVLMARLIHSEPLPGNRQFWVTRPYRWKSLVAAKALSVVIFVSLPKLIADAVILRAYGFQIGPELGGLLWTQILLTAVFVLPVAALSAVTTGLVQLGMVTLLLGLAAVAWDLATSQFAAGATWPALEWTRSYSAGLLVAVAALAIILWQYRRRDTRASRLLAGGAVVMALAATVCLPWTAAFAIQSRLASQPVEASAVRIDLRPEKWATRALVDGENPVELTIGLRLSGIPGSLRPVADGIAATIEGAAGAVWQADGQPWRHVQPEGAVISFRTRVSSSFYRKVKDQPARLRGSLYLTLYGNPRYTFLRLQDRALLVPTPGVGLCSAVRTPGGVVVNCRSAFRSRPDIVTYNVVANSRSGQPMSLRELTHFRPASSSPFPADAELVPVTQTIEHTQYFDRVTGVSVEAIEPVAHIRKDFELTGLRLADYETIWPPVWQYSLNH